MTDPINVLASKPVNKLNLSERLLGRRVTMPVYAEGELTPAALDLGADTFWALFKREPELTPVMGREGNHAILSWALDNPGTQKARQSVIGNLVASTTSAALMHVHLMSDEVAAEVLKKQEESEQAAAAAEAAQQAAAAAEAAVSAFGQAEAEANDQAAAAEAAGDSRAKNAAKQAAAAAAKAKKQAQQAAAAAKVAEAEAKANHSAAAAELAELAEKLASDKVSRASLQQAAQKAAEDGKDLADQLESWGLDPANPSTLDIAAALRYAQNSDNKIARIARVLGQAKKIALTQRQGAMTEKGHTPTSVIYTQELNALFPEELARLSDHTPAVSRLMTWGSYLDHGLMGWEKKSPAKEKGNFYAIVDESGSMGWHGAYREVAAKGVALGIAAAAKQDGRRFRLGAFSSDSIAIRETDSSASFDELIAWAEQFQDGGTDFDYAITWLLDQAEADQDPKADLVIISDGDGGYLTPEVIHRLNVDRQRKGFRLYYIAIGGVFARLAELADIVIKTDGRDHEAMAEALAGGMTQTA